MKIAGSNIVIQAAALISIIGVVAAQLPGHSVGDEVCVVGYAMDELCIAQGACENWIYLPCFRGMFPFD